MNSMKAIFMKQLRDTRKNPSVLVQFIIFPAVAFLMTTFVARGPMAEYIADGMPETMFITMMAGVFVGMALVPFVAGIVAEDKEKKSLRFLIMAGVKPGGYLLGIGSVIFVIGLVPAAAFALMAQFRIDEFLIFMAVMMSGVIASTFLGLSIGIMSKNAQSATAMAMPLAMVLGFAPTISPFNENVERFARFFYTQHLNVVMDSFYTVTGYAPDTGAIWQSFGVIWANIAVLVVFFAVAFASKGLKD